MDSVRPEGRVGRGLAGQGERRVVLLEADQIARVQRDTQPVVRRERAEVPDRDQALGGVALAEQCREPEPRHRIVRVARDGDARPGQQLRCEPAVLHALADGVQEAVIDDGAVQAGGGLVVRPRLLPPLLLRAHGGEADVVPGIGGLEARRRRVLGRGILPAPETGQRVTKVAMVAGAVRVPGHRRLEGRQSRVELSLAELGDGREVPRQSRVRRTGASLRRRPLQPRRDRPRAHGRDLEQRGIRRRGRSARSLGGRAAGKRGGRPDQGRANETESNVPRCHAAAPLKRGFAGDVHAH